MSEEPATPETEEVKNDGAREGSADPWQEVGRQFQELGESLAVTFKAFWNNEEVRRQAEEMKTGLESMVKNVGEAVKETASSPEVQQAREEAVKAAGSFREAGEQAAHEVRPHLLNALRQVNEELQKLIQRMEQARPEPEGEEPGSPDASA